MFRIVNLCVSVPCCPESVSVSAVSADTLEITWTASQGAELYQTRAADNSEVILCNDTAPVCALSDLSCDSSYTVSITPCNEISGCNHACKSHTKDTGKVLPVAFHDKVLIVYSQMLIWLFILFPEKSLLYLCYFETCRNSFSDSRKCVKPMARGPKRLTICSYVAINITVVCLDII